MTDPIQKPARSPRVPEPYGTVCPWVITRDTGAFIDFATEAFGAQEIARVVNPDGAIGHAELFIGESVVLAFDSRPHWPTTPAFLRIYVDDADADVRAGRQGWRRAGHAARRHAVGRSGRSGARSAGQPVVGDGRRDGGRSRRTSSTAAGRSRSTSR